MKVMERVIAMTERRLLDDRGPAVLRPAVLRGEQGRQLRRRRAYEGSKFAVADASGARLESAVFLFKRDERPKPR